MKITTLDDLDQFTKQVATSLTPGTIFLLNGEMGAGKTTFVGSVCKHFGFHDVSSPTFSIVNEYKTSPPIYHIDLYRCETSQSLDSIDLEHYLKKSSHVLFIEWAEKAPLLKSYDTTSINFNVNNEFVREITIN